MAWALKQPIKKVFHNDQSVIASHNPRFQYNKEFISERSEQTNCVCNRCVLVFVEH